MQLRILLPSALLIAGVTTPLAYASHVRRGPTAGHAHTAHGGGKSGKSHAAAVSNRPRAIDDARANEIQTALVKAGYLQTASGHWDEASSDAMRKMQADNGWQTKLIPDSRALIKLGLGPGADAASGGNATGTVTSNLLGTAEAAPTEQ